MGNKIFISYKYADQDVRTITGNYFSVDSVRDYVDKIEELIGESSHIYKAEPDGEDLSHLSEESIWRQLRSRIYDSSLTVVLISKNMKDSWKQEKDQWIPREISYSLKEMSRINNSGISVTSRSNALLAVIVPDKRGNYDYFTYRRTCCNSGCRILQTDRIFRILRDNMFNQNTPDVRNCENGSNLYYGECSYVESVLWDDFIRDMDYHIEQAYKRLNNIENYTLCKEV